MKVKELFNIYPEHSFGWWFNKIPDEEIKKLAFENLKNLRYPIKSEKNVFEIVERNNLGSALRCSFSWARSPQGYDFWNELSEKYKDIK